MLTLFQKMILFEQITLFKKMTLLQKMTLFQKNEAFESHLVDHPNITDEPYEPNTSQLFGKEDIHSMDKRTIMGIDYARLSLKTQSLLKSAIANLPTDIQSCILESKAMFKSSDLWFRHFKILVTTAIPHPANSDDFSDILQQADWKEHFGSSLRVYEKKHPLPGLLVNYDHGSGIANNYDEGSDSDDVRGVLIGSSKCLSMALLGS